MKAINITEWVYKAVFAAGLIILFGWLLKTRLGLNALQDCKVRRNRMPMHFPFIFFFVWVSVGSFVFILLEKFFEEESLEIYIARAIISLSFLIVGLFFANYYFVRGLKGFGINITKLPADVFFAVASLIGVWPLIIFGISAVIFVGKLIYGESFAFEAHQSLVTIKDSADVLQTVIMLFMIVLITPAFEEIMFRGFLQSMLVSRLKNPYLAIVLTSGLFTSLHQSMHWLAIFPLSLCLGYSYEKSSSIIRPILIHIVFNAFNTFSVLCLQ